MVLMEFKELLEDLVNFWVGLCGYMRHSVGLKEI